MNEQSIIYHIKVIGQTITEMRKTNEEFCRLQQQYCSQQRTIWLEVCALMTDVDEANFYENYKPITDDFADFATSPTPLLENPNINYGNGFGNQPKSTDEIIKEIRNMIIELRIKGSVRERPNGLIEYRSGLLGSIYGRTKEEIEQQITKKLKEVKTNKKTGLPLLKTKLRCCRSFLIRNTCHIR